MSAATVTIEIRSFPPMLVYLVEATDDPIERKQLAALGRWEIRMAGGKWGPLYLEDKN